MGEGGKVGGVSSGALDCRRLAMGFAKIQGKLPTRIGSSVKFGAPGDVKGKGGRGVEGKIVDEVWLDKVLNNSSPHSQPCRQGPHCWGDYSFCAQLIEWGDKTRDIRLAYYRRPCGENSWEYASQMTVTSAPQTIKALLEKTLAKSAWFQKRPISSNG